MVSVVGGNGVRCCFEHVLEDSLSAGKGGQLSSVMFTSKRIETIRSFEGSESLTTVTRFMTIYVLVKVFSDVAGSITGVSEHRIEHVKLVFCEDVTLIGYSLTSEGETGGEVEGKTVYSSNEDNTVLIKKEPVSYGVGEQLSEGLLRVKQLNLDNFNLKGPILAVIGRGKVGLGV